MRSCVRAGPSGKDFADAALTKGHQLTLYLRNPAKLDESLGSNPQVRVIIGTLTEKDKLRDALAGGIDAVITFAGPVANSKGTVRCTLSLSSDAL